MNVSPVSGQIPPALPFAMREPAAAQTDRFDIRRATKPAPAELVGSREAVEFTTHGASGADVVRFYDKRSGALTGQFPAQAVLDAVTDLVARVQREITGG